MLRKMSVEDFDLKRKKVLVRVDFNVPLAGKKVRDDTRIKAALPTINYLLKNDAVIILASHLGRPGGQPCEELKMDPVADRLSFLLNMSVRKMDQVVGSKVKDAVNKMKPREILLLENLRFDKGEEDNSPYLSQQLADLAEVFVNDAFGTAHRAHASTVGVASYIPAISGLLMKKEIDVLSKCLDDPPRPMTVILGGAKVSDKINVIRRFLSLADNLLLGGGMANTFLAASGYEMGSSFYESNLVKEAKKLLGEAVNSKCSLHIPKDLVITDDLKANGKSKTVNIQNLNDKWKAVDIGEETVSQFKDVIKQSSLVIWNGPLGVFEMPPYDKGTKIVAKTIAESKAYSVVGGGDIVAALKALKFSDQIDFISTGGGATLEFWEGKDLPGITVLKNAT